MTEFITITLFGLLMIISPGPDFAVVTKTSLIQGRLAGMLSAVGVAIANLCHVTLNLLGIGVIISQSLLAFTIMKVLGAGYLIYIGYKGLRAKPFPVTSEEAGPLSDGGNITAKVGESLQNLGRRGFISGFFTSILNPKACLFYLSFFSVIISSTTPLGHQIFYGVWLSTLACAWFVLVALFFTNPYIGAKLKKAKHWIERITGGALVLLGLRLLSAKA